MFNMTATVNDTIKPIQVRELTNESIFNSIKKAFGLWAPIVEVRWNREEDGMIDINNVEVDIFDHELNPIGRASFGEG